MTTGQCQGCLEGTRILSQQLEVEGDAGALGSGQVTSLAGMTREQVAVALGYPVSSENPDLDAPLWRYWLDSFTEFQVEFDGSGQITGVVALPTVLSRVWMP